VTKVEKSNPIVNEHSVKFSNNRSITVSRCKNRKDSRMVPAECDINDFVKDFTQAKRLLQSQKEYLTLSKEQQDDLKDYSPFIIGTCKNNSRKNGNVTSRDAICLDMDFAPTGTTYSGIPLIWEEYDMLFGNAGFLYETCKSTKINPRYRFVLFMDRSITSEEYKKISSYVANSIGLEYFDKTTFSPERIMYSPVRPSDSDYIFQFCDGPLMNADKILETTSVTRTLQDNKTEREIQYGIKKQADPLNKKGIVGAFCRTHTITGVANKFLPGIYESCDTENRLTYKPGSTTGGLVIYDDKLCYSNHDTDPAGKRTCNAFDLVRLHKFGKLDNESKRYEGDQDRPSFKAMVDFIMEEDCETIITLTDETNKSAAEDFGSIDLEPELNNEWKGKLRYNGQGKLNNTSENLVLILENDPAICKLISYDRFEHREILSRKPYWRNITHATRYVTDTDVDNIRHFINTKYRLRFTEYETAFSVLRPKYSFHPVEHYLSKLEWDGTHRVETLLIDYLGAKDSEYVRAVTRKAMAAAVARIFEPGVKFDYMLVLIGRQGVGKSQLLFRLGSPWFSDSLFTIKGKEGFEQLQGVWLVEWGELAGLRKADMDSVKNFITKREDRYRVSYGKRTENFPRQCIFFGTTNNKDFLHDDENRRFWPVDVAEQAPGKNLFTDLSQDEVKQVWAEAVQLYKDLEPLILSAKLEKIAFEAQEQHREADDWTGSIKDYLEIKVPENWLEIDVYSRRSFINGDPFYGEGKLLRNRISVAEIWCELLGGQLRDMTTMAAKRLHTIMRKMNGWQEYKSKTDIKFYGTQRAYIRTAGNGSIVDGPAVLPAVNSNILNGYTANTAAVTAEKTLTGSI
jgi:putative DNA primase/helicase